MIDLATARGIPEMGTRSYRAPHGYASIRHYAKCKHNSTTDKKRAFCCVKPPERIVADASLCRRCLPIWNQESASAVLRPSGLDR